MLWRNNKKFTFVSGSATALPFQPGSFDVILSMFVIEHLVFPTRFLDGAWTLLRSRGRLIIVAPDFWRGVMASEPIGLSYGPGREKLSQGKILDALLTLYDTRLRLAWLRHCRRREIEKGLTMFPIFTEPRCLQLPGFTPDCDAIYLSCPEEIVSYLGKKKAFQSSEIFHRDKSTFGLLILKN
jgi:SAM-dependent methyltransferase